MAATIAGIDPAPRKETTVFDGSRFRTLAPSELSVFIEDLRRNESVLVCWDSPLTGPATADPAKTVDRDYSQRPIERFFSRKEYGFKVPHGISVRPYSGCPHWTISRAMVGLPRVGPWDAPPGDLPFRLVSSDVPRLRPGHHIVEVHPAVGIWLWCKDALQRETWEYKTDQDCFNAVWECLHEQFASRGYLPSIDIAPANDDELDAFVAYMLGLLWTRLPDEVLLLGNQRTGSILLPTTRDLAGRFEDFCRRDLEAPPEADACLVEAGEPASCE